MKSSFVIVIVRMWNWSHTRFMTKLNVNSVGKILIVGYSAGKVIVLTDHKCVEIILVSFGLVE